MDCTWKTCQKTQQRLPTVHDDFDITTRLLMWQVRNESTKKTAKTSFMRESTKQSDLSCIVVLLHELNSSTKWIAQRQCVHIARTCVLQRLQNWMGDINMIFLTKPSYIRSLHQHDYLLIYWVLYHVICIVNAFPCPQTLHHIPFAFKLFLVLPNCFYCTNTWCFFTARTSDVCCFFTARTRFGMWLHPVPETAETAVQKVCLGMDP